MNNIQLDFEFEIGNKKKYKVNSIENSAVYTKKLIMR